MNECVCVRWAHRNQRQCIRHNGLFGLLFPLIIQICSLKVSNYIEMWIIFFLLLFLPSIYRHRPMRAALNFTVIPMENQIILSQWSSDRNVFAMKIHYFVEILFQHLCFVWLTVFVCQLAEFPWNQLWYVMITSPFGNDSHIHVWKHFVFAFVNLANGKTVQFDLRYEPNKLSKVLDLAVYATNEQLSKRLTRSVLIPK